MKKITLFLLTAMFLASDFTANAAINLTLSPVNGACASDCRINASATGTTGSVTYSLIDYPSPGQNSTPQTSGSFTGLAPGTYTVGVYDATTAGVPVTKTVTVTTSYVDLLPLQPVVSNNSNIYCGNNGSLNISFTGGKEPFTVRITNTTDNTYQEVTTSLHSYKFDLLAPGNYTCKVTDDCGVGIENSATIAPSTSDLSSSIFTSVAFVSSYQSYASFDDSGNCNDFSITLRYSDVKIYLNHSPTPFNMEHYTLLKCRVEYPAFSGIYSEWKNIYTYSIHSFNTFDRSLANGDKFRIEVQHPCLDSDADGENDVTTSPEYTIDMPVFQVRTDFNASSYCAVDLVFDLANIGPNLSVTHVDGCGPYTVELKERDTDALIGTQTTPASGDAYTEVRFSGLATTAYYATITSPNGFSQTLPNITVSPIALPIINFLEFDNVKSDVNGYYNRGYNAIFCDFNTGALGLQDYQSTQEYINGLPVTFSIAAVSPTPSIDLPPVTITGDIARILWDNIPWGTYDITVDFACTTKVERKTLTQKVDAFTVASCNYEPSTTTCPFHDIVGDAYFSLNGSRITNDNQTYRYWMLIVDGPAKIGERAMGYPDNTPERPGARMRDLPGGTYTVLFYPHDVPTSTQTINGKTVKFYPTTMYSCYEVRTITVPDYVRPEIDIPMSGGITCTSGTTNLTVNVLKGNRPPFLYQYKVKGASDATYTPAEYQSSNVFSNLPNGDYTVRIKDQCGSFTPQDVRIFNGTEQFVGITGEVLPGVVCETREITLTVLSIGPVQSYLWEYREDDNAPWITLPSTTGTYVIPSANQSHKGQYRVTIYNGQCNLSSNITIIDVLSPPDTPSITSPTNVICPGGNTTLTANTTIPSPNYQWYKDGSPVGTNSATYTATSVGSYTVVVTPSSGCPSNPSDAFVVSEGISVQPASGRVYVTVNGAGNMDGSSWANAYAGLADPLFTAQAICSGIKEIWVARGTYHPLHRAGNGISDRDNAFVLVAGVKIYGGFTGRETSLSERNLAQNPSILSGDNSYHTVISAGSMIRGADTARLDGFVVRNGKAKGSGTITVNSQPISANSGGGIYFATSAPNIVNVEIKGSEASASGGGIYANNSSPKLINAVVSGNVSANSGGGIYLAGGSPALTNITVSGNRAATSGGGIYMNSSSPQIGNSIVWGNAAGSNNNVHSTGGSPAYQYSLIQDLNPSGAGNINGTNPSNDPVFVLSIPASSAPTIDGYYRPQLGSPALNAGNNALNREPTDIESYQRIQESKIELGAYEVNYNFECNCE